MDEIINQRKKKKRILLLIAIAAVAAVILFVVFGKKDDTGDEDQFKSEEIVRRDIVSSVSGTGTIKAKHSHEITASLTGAKIEHVYVSEGDVVKKGDRLVAFDTSDLLDAREDLVKRKNDTIEDREDTIEDREEQDERYDSEMEERYEEYHLNLEIARENMEVADENYAQAKSDLEAYQKQYNSTDFSSAPEGTKAQMDATLAQMRQNLQTARASKNTARRSYETILNSDDNSLPDAKKNYDELSDSTIENYDTIIENIEDSISDIDEQLSDALLVAPADGTVTEVYAEEGDNYYGGNLAVIEGTDVLYVEAAISEYDVPDVRPGMTAVLKTDATRDEELIGEVDYVAPKSGSSSGGAADNLLSGLGSSLGGGMDFSGLSSSIGGSSSSGAEYTVRIDIKEKNDRLRIGMSAKISIVLEEADDVLSVPMEAVQTKDDGTKVIYLMREDADADTEDEKKSLFSKKGDDKKDDEKAADETDLSSIYDEVTVDTGLEGTYYVEIITDADIEGRQVVIPESDSIQSVDDLLNVMGSAGGF